jgi:hypothetical protein
MDVHDCPGPHERDVVEAPALFDEPDEPMT